MPKGRTGRLSRATLVDNLTDVIERLDEVKATGPVLLQVAAAVEDLTAIRDWLDPQVDSWREVFEAETGSEERQSGQSAMLANGKRRTFGRKTLTGIT